MANAYIYDTVTEFNERFEGCPDSDLKLPWWEDSCIYFDKMYGVFEAFDEHLHYHATVLPWVSLEGKIKLVSYPLKIG